MTLLKTNDIAVAKHNCCLCFDSRLAIIRDYLRVAERRSEQVNLAPLPTLLISTFISFYVLLTFKYTLLLMVCRVGRLLNQTPF